MTRDPNNFQGPPSRPAFTLVELLVAIIMLAVLTGATFTAVSQVIRSRDTGVGRASAFQRANLAADLIAADATMALRDADLVNSKVAILPTAGPVRSDSLLLFTHTSSPIRPASGQSEGSECECQYRVEPSPPGGGGGTLWRRRQPVPDDKPDAGGVATALVNGVLALTFEASDGSTWRDRWDSDTDGFPYALRLTVLASDDSGRKTVSARRVVAFDRTPPPFKTTTAGQSTTPTGTTNTGSSTPGSNP